MALKITPAQIEQMIQLYDEVKTYSGVAKLMGVSASTVSKYIKAAKESVRAAEPSNFPIVAPLPIEQIAFLSMIDFSNLNDAEIESYNAWLKEFNRA